MASVIYVSADAETHLGQVRAILPDIRREHPEISFLYSRAGARQFRVAKIVMPILECLNNSSLLDLGCFKCNLPA
jgi:hypothetical protein